jgi:hypothetical protein
MRPALEVADIFRRHGDAVRELARQMRDKQIARLLNRTGKPTVSCCSRRSALARPTTSNVRHRGSPCAGKRLETPRPVA